MLLCHVFIQIGLLARSIITYRTLERTFTRVLSFMNLSRRVELNDIKKNYIEKKWIVENV